MKIIKLLASLAIFTIGASIDPGTVRAQTNLDRLKRNEINLDRLRPNATQTETNFDRQMRTAMEAETKALGQRIVAGTNPPLTYAQMRTLADTLSAKYKAAGKRLNPKELMERTGVECKTQVSGGCPDYLAHMESFFRYFTEPAPVLSDKFRLQYFETTGKAFDIYSARINFQEGVAAPAAEEDPEYKRQRIERENERAKREAEDAEYQERRRIWKRQREMNGLSW
jgi:hypothetical protein